MEPEYELSYKKLQETEPIRGYWELGNKCCALGRVMRACGIKKVGDYIGSDADMFDFTGEAADFLKKAREAIGDARYRALIEKNDQRCGKFQENHELALSSTIEELTKAGMIKIATE